MGSQGTGTTAGCRHFELQSTPEADWTLPHLTQRPHKPIMLTKVTIELVRTLSQSKMISPGLLVLKPSSKSGLPIAWITANVKTSWKDLSITYKRSSVSAISHFFT